MPVRIRFLFNRYSLTFIWVIQSNTSIQILKTTMPRKSNFPLRTDLMNTLQTSLGSSETLPVNFAPSLSSVTTPDTKQDIKNYIPKISTCFFHLSIAEELCCAHRSQQMAPMALGEPTAHICWCPSAHILLRTHQSVVIYCPSQDLYCMNRLNLQPFHSSPPLRWIAATRDQKEQKEQCVSHP